MRMREWVGWEVGEGWIGLFECCIYVYGVFRLIWMGFEYSVWLEVMIIFVRNHTGVGGPR